jgi:Polyketide cyclase / dehydrase and lipid transport
MFTPIRREFIVDTSLKTAWEYLAQVSQWPTWAKHIKQIDLEPPGEVTPQSRGNILLKNGVRSTFRMTEFNPYQNWKWEGPFLWLTIHYDHRFEPIDDDHTKLIWVVGLTGIGASILGRIFAAFYNTNLNTAIPNLISEINGTQKNSYSEPSTGC